jgi:hypothetical protein
MLEPRVQFAQHPELRRVDQPGASKNPDRALDDTERLFDWHELLGRALEIRARPTSLS